MKWALLLLLLLPLASAKNLHDSTHYSEDTFTVDGEEYYIFHEWGESKVLVSAGSSSFLIAGNKCVEHIDREICITEINEDISSDEVKYSGGGALAAITVEINSLSPEVKVTRSVSESAPEEGETVSVTVVIENTGNRQVDRFVYVDEFPEELTLLGSAGNRFVKDGIIKAGQSLTLQYSLRADTFVKYTGKGRLNYSFAGINETVETSSLTIEVDAPYGITVEVDDEFLLGDDFDYELAIENKESDDMEVNLKITAPGLDISDKGNLTEISGGLQWSGTLVDETAQFDMEFLASKTGNHTITLEVSLEQGPDSYTFRDEKTVSVGINGADAVLTIIPVEVISGSDVKVAGRIENNDDFQYKVFDTHLDAFGESFSVTEEFVQKGDDILVIEEVVQAPEVAEAEEFPVVFRGRYSSPGGERFAFRTEDTVTVNPRSDQVEVRIEAPESTTGRFDVSVFVRNLGEAEVEAAVSSNVSEGLADSMSANVSLAPGEEKEAYSFTVEPGGFTGDLTITARADVGEAAEASRIVKIERAAQPLIEEPEQEEKGFFTRMVDGVVGFFSWLF